MLFASKNMLQSLKARFVSPVDLRLQFQWGHLPIHQGGPFVVGVAASSSDGPAAPAPHEEPGPIAPAVEDRLVPEGDAPRVSARVQA